MNLGDTNIQSTTPSCPVSPHICVRTKIRITGCCLRVSHAPSTPDASHTHENTRVHCWAAPRGLKGLGFPSFKTEERAWSQQQRQLFHGRGSLHVGGKVLK